VDEEDIGKEDEDHDSVQAGGEIKDTQTSASEKNEGG
jgi:hypothetical protein